MKKKNLLCECWRLIDEKPWKLIINWKWDNVILEGNIQRQICVYLQIKIDQKHKQKKSRNEKISQEYKQDRVFDENTLKNLTNEKSITEKNGSGVINQMMRHLRHREIFLLFNLAWVMKLMKNKILSSGIHLLPLFFHKLIYTIIEELSNWG